MSTAAHQVLLCAELYQLICDNCDVKTRSALSLTSRDLQETALNSLWSEISDLGPLIRCMPSDLWKEGQTIYVGRYKLFFRRLIRSTDWHRFHVNSARVKRFGFSVAGRHRHYDLDPLCYQMLCCNGMKLLPQVQEIYWKAERDSQIYPYITLLLSPMTCRLQLSFSGLSGEEGVKIQRVHLSLLPAMPTLSPHITNLTLSLADTRVECCHDVCDTLRTLCFWPSLQSLDIHYFPGTPVATISQIPNLRKLCIRNVIHSSPPQPYSLPSNFHGFSKLEELEIHFCHLASIVIVMAIMDNAPLRSLAIFQQSYDHEARRSAYWSEIINGIRRGIAHHASLDTLRLNFGMPDHKKRPMSFEKISGLLVFTNLTQLELWAEYGFDLDDEQMETFVSAFPRLKSLKLLAESGLPSHRPRMTFEGLRSIAQHCQTLKDLAVVFDPRSTIKYSKHDHICNVNTRSINVWDSPIDDPAAVSEVLLDIFPNLIAVAPVDEYDNEIEGLKQLQLKWEEVNRLINLNRWNRTEFPKQPRVWSL